MLPLCGNLLLALIRRCGGMVDTGDLKSPGSNTVPVRVRSPAPSGKTIYRGVEQLVARRAHNPEVGGSSPPSATISSGCNGFQLHPLLFLSLCTEQVTPAPFPHLRGLHSTHRTPPGTTLSDSPTARRKHTQQQRPRGYRRCSSDGTVWGRYPDTRRTCSR